MDREQIVKALECLVDNYSENGSYSTYVTLRDALALIKSQEQKIFELENRLKECENGYEGTLYLDRCKLHDAEEKVKELTEENERLRAENKKIGIENFDLICELSRIKEDTVREFADRLKTIIATLKVERRPASPLTISNRSQRR